MMEKIHRIEHQETLIFIWFLDIDNGSEKNVVKIYAVATSLEGARRHVMNVPGTGEVIRTLVEKTEPLVCAVPFAEVNISANGKVSSMIRAERRS